MMVKYILPLLAAALLIFAVTHAISIQRPEAQTVPPVQPSQSPFGDTVAGAGMVEPSTEASGTGNIAVGSQLAGAVTNVAVRIGQEVKADDLLFELDSRLTEADLKVREANVTVGEAQVSVVEANLRQTQDQYERAKKGGISGVIAEQDVVTAEQAYLSAPGAARSSEGERAAGADAGRAGPNAASTPESPGTGGRHHPPGERPAR